MKPNLEVLSPDRWCGQRLPLSVFPYLIGRDSQCTLRATSPTISRRHCCLFERGGQLVVRDFNSTNGTFVNGESVRGERELQDGDRLAVGPFVFSLCLPDESDTLLPVEESWRGSDYVGADESMAMAENDDLAAYLVPAGGAGHWSE